MTLVVAHRISYGVRLAADMRVVDRAAARPVPSHSTGVLKVVTVHPKACVAFAGGPVEAALDAIRRLEVPTGRRVDAARIEDNFLEEHVRMKGQIDFIVATLSPTTLALITGGAITRGRQSAWIGDQEAFDRFQAVYHGEPWLPWQVARDLPEEEHAAWADRAAKGRAELRERTAAALRDSELWPGELADASIAERATDAMQAVIQSSISSVGEHGITVMPRPPGDKDGDFAYLEMSSASLPGSAAHGNFSHTILTPEEPGVGAVGIYFLEGRLGLLYHPLKFDDPQSYADVSVGEFKRMVYGDHEFTLGGIGIGGWEGDNPTTF